MNIKYTCLLLAITILFSCKTQEKYNDKIIAKHTPQELKKDLEIVKQSLEDNHPGVYWYISKKELDFKFDSLNNALTNPLTPLEFFRELAPIVAAVKCGHTKLIYSGLSLNKSQKDSIKKAGSKPMSQLYYFVDNNRIFIKGVNNIKLKQPLKGAELLAIDNKSALEIINNVQTLFSSDGYNKTFYNAVLNKFFDTYYYLGYGKTDSTKLTLMRNDSTYNYVLKTIKPVKEDKKQLTLEEIGKKKIVDKKSKKVKKENRYKGIDDFGKPLLDFKYDSTLNSTAIMTVKSFSFTNANFKKFFKESFNELKEKNTQHLILDLRNNGGGDLMACNRLFRYLYNKPHQFNGKSYMNSSYLYSVKYEEIKPFFRVAKIITFPINLIANVFLTHKDSIGKYGFLPTTSYKKPLENVYNNDLIVLTNGYSFSATSLLSANLQSVNRGTFIGQETGGGYNQCTAGRIPFLNLPNTGLKLRLPLKVIQITEKRKLYGKGVFPKYEVKESFEEVLKGKDLVMDEARRKIINR